jgi:transglutaminase-like putative cysteine protease
VYVQQPAPRPTYLAQLPAAAQGTRTTLQMMSALVVQFSGRVRQLAQSITSHLESKDYAGEIQALFEFVRDNIRYVRDAYGTETVQTPEATLSLESGDCDDKSTLLAALLNSLGFATRFKAIGMTPGEYQHVYVQAQLGSQWVSLDATQNVPAGWEPRGFTSVMIQNN